MLLTRLTDDELAELHQEYAAQLRLVADEMTRRAVEKYRAGGSDDGPGGPGSGVSS
jgi:hypothetical protein